MVRWSRGFWTSSTMPRRSPLDSLADEKSLTTSAPQSRRYESCRSGFLRRDANLRRTYRSSLRTSFVGPTPAMPNLYAASKEGILLVGDSVEKWGLIPPEPDVPSVLTLPALAPTQTLLGSGRLSSPLSMVESGSYLQNENMLLKALSLNATFFTWLLPTTGSSPFGITHAVARHVLFEDYNSSESCPLRGS